DDALHLGPIALGSNLDAAGALHRLAGERGNVLGAGPQDLILQSTRGSNAEGFRRFAVLGLAVPVRIDDVAEALIDGVAVRMHVGHAAHRTGGNRRPGIGALARDDDAPLGLAFEHPIVTD